MTPNPRSRALDLAIPIASCAGAGISTAHLTEGLSRDELAALADLLALAASGDPVRLRALVAAGDGMTPAMISREVLLRKAHTAANRLRRDGLEVPVRLRVLDGEYRREREKATGRKGRPKTAAKKEAA